MAPRAPIAQNDANASSSLLTNGVHNSVEDKPALPKASASDFDSKQNETPANMPGSAYFDGEPPVNGTSQINNNNNNNANPLLYGGGLNANTLSQSLYNPTAGSLYGVPGGFGGYYGGGTGYGGGYNYYGQLPPLGPMSSLNQFLFGVQSVIFSLSQAVQIIGMNTEAVKHLFESVSAMFDHAVASWQEMRALEFQARDVETPEARKRRRRLRSLRWALACAITYAGYSVIRKLLSSARRRTKRYLPAGTSMQNALRASHDNNPPYYAMSSQTPFGYDSYQNPPSMGYGFF